MWVPQGSQQVQQVYCGNTLWEEAKLTQTGCIEYTSDGNNSNEARTTRRSKRRRRAQGRPQAISYQPRNPNATNYANRATIRRTYNTPALSCVPLQLPPSPRSRTQQHRRRLLQELFSTRLGTQRLARGMGVAVPHTPATPSGFAIEINPADSDHLPSPTYLPSLRGSPTNLAPNANVKSNLSTPTSKKVSVSVASVCSSLAKMCQESKLRKSSRSPSRSSGGSSRRSRVSQQSFAEAEKPVSKWTIAREKMGQLAKFASPLWQTGHQSDSSSEEAANSPLLNVNTDTERVSTHLLRNSSIINPRSNSITTQIYNGRYHAVVIAVSSYDDSSFPPCPRVTQDSIDLVRLLKVHGYSTDYLHKNSPTRPTKSHICSAIQASLKAVPKKEDDAEEDPCLLVFFLGRVVSNVESFTNGMSYLQAEDSSIEELDPDLLLQMLCEKRDANGNKPLFFVDGYPCGRDEPMVGLGEPHTKQYRDVSRSRGYCVVCGRGGTGTWFEARAPIKEAANGHATPTWGGGLAFFMLEVLRNTEMNDTRILLNSLNIFFSLKLEKYGFITATSASRLQIGEIKLSGAHRQKMIKEKTKLIQARDELKLSREVQRYSATGFVPFAMYRGVGMHQIAALANIKFVNLRAKAEHMMHGGNNSLLASPWVRKAEVYVKKYRVLISREGKDSPGYKQRVSMISKIGVSAPTPGQVARNTIVPSRPSVWHERKPSVKRASSVFAPTPPQICIEVSEPPPCIIEQPRTPVLSSPEGRSPGAFLFAEAPMLEAPPSKAGSAAGDDGSEEDEPVLGLMKSASRNCLLRDGGMEDSLNSSGGQSPLSPLSPVSPKSPAKKGRSMRKAKRKNKASFPEIPIAADDIPVIAVGEITARRTSSISTPAAAPVLSLFPPQQLSLGSSISPLSPFPIFGGSEVSGSVRNQRPSFSPDFPPDSNEMEESDEEEEEEEEGDDSDSYETSTSTGTSGDEVVEVEFDEDNLRDELQQFNEIKRRKREKQLEDGRDVDSSVSISSSSGHVDPSKILNFLDFDAVNDKVSKLPVVSGVKHIRRECSLSLALATCSLERQSAILQLRLEHLSQRAWVDAAINLLIPSLSTGNPIGTDCGSPVTDADTSSDPLRVQLTYGDDISLEVVYDAQYDFEVVTTLHRVLATPGGAVLHDLPVRNVQVRCSFNLLLTKWERRLFDKFARFDGFCGLIAIDAIEESLQSEAHFKAAVRIQRIFRSSRTRMFVISATTLNIDEVKGRHALAIESRKCVETYFTDYLNVWTETHLCKELFARQNILEWEGENFQAILLKSFKRSSSLAVVLAQRRVIKKDEERCRLFLQRHATALTFLLVEHDFTLLSMLQLQVMQMQEEAHLELCEEQFQMYLVMSNRMRMVIPTHRNLKRMKSKYASKVGKRAMLESQHSMHSSRAKKSGKLKGLAWPMRPYVNQTYASSSDSSGGSPISPEAKSFRIKGKPRLPTSSSSPKVASPRVASPKVASPRVASRLASPRLGSPKKSSRSLASPRAPLKSAKSIRKNK